MMNSDSDSIPAQNLNEMPTDAMNEQISALQCLIGNLVANAHDIIPKLGGNKIVGAKCNIVDVADTNGSSKRCYLQIQTVNEFPTAPVSSASLEEITEEAFAETNKPDKTNNKRKKKNIMDEALCRRSNKLAKLTMGFKDKASAVAAVEHQASTSTNNAKGKNKAVVNLGPKFDAIVIDRNAPPPLPLPLQTIQAIGTGPCKMNTNEVSSAALNYDSSDE